MKKQVSRKVRIERAARALLRMTEEHLKSYPPKSKNEDGEHLS
jgi:hypothetical protein